MYYPPSIMHDTGHSVGPLKTGKTSSINQLRGVSHDSTGCGGGEMHETTPWVDRFPTAQRPGQRSREDRQPGSRHDIGGKTGRGAGRRRGERT